MLVRALAACVLAVALAGCATTSWRRADPDPRGLAVLRPDALRLTLHDGRRLVVHHPDIRSDSVVGVTPDGFGRLAVATADVKRYEVRRVWEEGRSPGERAGVAALGVAVLALFVALVILPLAKTGGL